jgi:hypothetical protein
VIPDGFNDFLVASGGVAGALIGLLFVAISVAPERVLQGSGSAVSHRLRASTALTTFTNALTISLFTLIPGLGAGWTAACVAIVGLLFVAGSLLTLLQARRSHPGDLRDATFLIGVVVVFVLQLWFGLRLIDDDGDEGALQGVCVLVVVCFLIGISRAWELIGGPQFSLFGQLRARAREHGDDG